MTITINGSGSITGLSAGGLPDATITQADLASGVAGSGPAFSAGAHSLQSITNTTVTKLTFGTEEFDTANCYDNTTNYRFTPNVAGYYQVNVGIQLNNSVSGLNLYIFKNGAAIKSSGADTPGSASKYSMSALVYLNGSTDYLELYVWQNGGTVTTSNNTQWNYFQASLVRAA